MNRDLSRPDICKILDSSGWQNCKPSALLTCPLFPLCTCLCVQTLQTITPYVTVIYLLDAELLHCWDRVLCSSHWSLTQLCSWEQPWTPDPSALSLAFSIFNYYLSKILLYPAIHLLPFFSLLSSLTREAPFYLSSAFCVFYFSFLHHCGISLCSITPVDHNGFSNVKLTFHSGVKTFSGHYEVTSLSVVI